MPDLYSHVRSIRAIISKNAARALIKTKEMAIEASNNHTD